MTIFCDGGIGNRINSLVSRMVIAKYFNFSYLIHWPENNWLSASFSDIFKNNLPISNLSIKELRGKFKEANVLLHDEIASQALNVPFNSAYSYRRPPVFSSTWLWSPGVNLTVFQ